MSKRWCRARGGASPPGLVILGGVPSGEGPRQTPGASGLSRDPAEFLNSPNALTTIVIFTSVAHAPRRTKRHENSRAIFNGVSKVRKSHKMMTRFGTGASLIISNPYLLSHPISLAQPLSPSNNPSLDLGPILVSQLRQASIFIEVLGHLG
jgi:hypothetical protein